MYPKEFDLPGTEKSEGFLVVTLVRALGLTVHLVVHDDTGLRYDDFAAKEQVDGCRKRHCQSRIIGCADI